MTNKEKKQVEKAIAKEIKAGVKNYRVPEQEFLLDNAIRYELTPEEVKALQFQYETEGVVVDEAEGTLTVEVDPQ